MTPPKKRSATNLPRTAQRLKTCLVLLDAFALREANQHSKSVWWKKFMQLRRGARRMLNDIDGLHLTNAARHAEHLSKHVLPICHCAFSQLLADAQFGALGVAIFAITADVSSCVAQYLQHRRLSSRQGAVKVDAGAHSSRATPRLTERRADEDIGNPIQRAEVAPSPPQSTVARSKSSSTDMHQSRTKSQSQSLSKKRGIAAIDRLFSGF